MLDVGGSRHDGSITARRPSEMRWYAWEFVAFDDQEVGVPAPHNSALARTYVALGCGPGLLANRDRTGRIRVSSQVRSNEVVGADAPRANVERYKCARASLRL